MAILNSFTENFFSTVRMLGRSPGGDLLLLPSGTVAGATGLPYAGENYALFTSSATIDDLYAVLDFFKSRKLPFLVPQFPEMDEKFCALLALHGLEVRRSYTAMSIRVISREDPHDRAVIKISDHEQICEWADSSWAGFGGARPAPDNFRSLTKYMANCGENDLFYLNSEGQAACTGLLHNTGGTCGLYYFATLPELRRRGLAGRLMRSLVWQASCFSDNLVLLATEAGLPMYSRFGFNTIAQIPVRSINDDI